MEWTWLIDWWRLKRWRKNKTSENDSVCFCDECLQDAENVIKFLGYSVPKRQLGKFERRIFVTNLMSSANQTKIDTIDRTGL